MIQVIKIIVILVLLLLFFMVKHGQTPDEGVWLTDHTVEKVSPENLRFSINRALDGHRFSVNNLIFENGIQTYGVSTLEYVLEKKYTHFRCWVGVDDRTSRCETAGSAILSVVVDGREIFKSAQLDLFTNPLFLNLNVKNADILQLITRPVNKNTGCLYTDWINPELVKLK